MPLFALANAGVTLDAATLGSAIGHPVTIGAMLGLLIGKPLGIAGFSWLAVRLGLAALPRGASWTALSAVAALGGIGFTMALFIAGLAFPAGTPRGELLDAAKLGILGASALAGIAGSLLLKRALRPAPDSAREDSVGTVVCDWRHRARVGRDSLGGALTENPEMPEQPPQDEKDQDRAEAAAPELLGAVPGGEAAKELAHGRSRT